MNLNKGLEINKTVSIFLIIDWTRKFKFIFHKIHISVLKDLMIQNNSKTFGQTNFLFFVIIKLTKLFNLT